MTSWLALSLGLWLGQTPGITPPLPPDADTQDPAALELREAWERALLNADGTVQMPVLDVSGTGATPGATAGAAGATGAEGTGGAGGAGTSGDAQPQEATPPAGGDEAATRNLQQEVQQLRAQVQELQASQLESATRTEAIEQQLTGIRDRSEELERMRQERVAELERAGTWLIAADQALAVGELDVGDALQEADAALAQVVQSASEVGSGQTVLHVEGARRAIARTLERAGNHDTYWARWELFNAAESLREARRQNLDEPSVTAVTR